LDSPEASRYHCDGSLSTGFRFNYVWQCGVTTYNRIGKELADMPILPDSRTGCGRLIIWGFDEAPLFSKGW